MEMWQITATVSRKRDGWQSTRQVPTFFLSGALQGIVSADHAARIALTVIDPYCELDASEFSIHADRVEMAGVVV